MSKLWCSVLALVAGLLMPLAFAPFDFYPLAMVSLAILFWLWSQSTARRAGYFGALFGLGMFGAGVNWVYISMYDFGHVPWFLSVLLTILFVSILALFPAAAAYIAVRLSTWARAQVGSVSLLLIYPAVWTLVEWLRGWLLTGFPWLNGGYSQLQSPLSGLAPVLGVYGVALALSFSSGLLLATFFKPSRPVRGIFLLGLIALWGMSSLLAKIEWTHPAGDPLQISLVQGNIPQDLKWHPGMLGLTLDTYTTLTEDHWDSDLIIWPETAVPMFSHEAQSFIDEMTARSRLNDTDLLLGLVYQEAPGAPYFNSMIGIGSSVSRYSKRHLVPFTEYLPLKSTLSGLIDALEVPMSDFTAGPDDQPPLLLAGQNIGISICFEDAFGEEMIGVLPTASLLVNVSNDAWFAGSVAAAQHLQMAQMRALETGRTLIRSTNTGITAFVDESGRVYASLPQFVTDVLTAEVQPRQGTTPYVAVGNLASAKFGNSPAVMLMLSMLIVGLWFSAKGRDQQQLN